MERALRLLKQYAILTGLILGALVVGWLVQDQPVYEEGDEVATTTPPVVDLLTNAELLVIRDKADVKLAQFWGVLQTKQEAYYAKHGKYFQLLVTNETTDGADVTFELIRPDDEPYPLDVTWDVNTTIPFKIKVGEWVGPDGEGYKAQVYLHLSDGRVFTRSRDSDQNDSGWYQI